MEKVEALEDMVSFVPSILINVSCVVLIESTGANFLMFFPTHTATLLCRVLLLFPLLQF
uniref:Uncharacterized protein n=1 Tax=Triticum urartu TaxID=4572 RepID=A0A8R7P8E6_TRIUA